MKYFLANDKNKIYVTVYSERLASHILIHLPPKNFKMVTATDFIQGIFLAGLKRQLMLSGKTLPCQDIHFIKGRCTGLSG